jgi:thiol-disulfide isomerase/thioredoxin
MKRLMSLAGVLLAVLSLSTQADIRGEFDRWPLQAIGSTTEPPSAGANGTVVVVLATQCPISRRMIPPLNELAAKAASQQLNFYGVISDDFTDVEAAAQFQREYKLAFPLFLDSSVTVAETLRSEIKPEAFVFTATGELAYRGRIDNRFAEVGKLRNYFDQHDLADAMTAVAAGETPRTNQTSPVGCVYHQWQEKGEN